MFTKKEAAAVRPAPVKPNSPREATSIVAGCVLEGKFSFKGATLIGCTIKGDVECDSLLIVEASAKIEGRISAREILVRGELSGDIMSNTSIEVWPGAVMSGSVFAPSLQIQDGAKVNADLLIAKERPVVHINKAPDNVTPLPVAPKAEEATSAQTRPMFVKAS